MSNTQLFKVKGMHCASCAGIIQKTLSRVPGVENVEVNYGTEKAKIVFDPALTDEKKLSSKIEPFGYAIFMPDVLGKNMKDEKLAELRDLKIKTLSAAPLALLSILGMSLDFLARYKNFEIPSFWMEISKYLFPLMATYVLFVVGKPYLRGLWRFVRHGNANMDTLVGIGTMAAYLYSVVILFFSKGLERFLNVESSYFDVVIVVITFITLGKYLEMKSKVKTGDAIEKLLNLQAKTATVVRDGKEMEIAAENVVLGDILLIKPSGKIPVDGILIEGSSYVDESMISGEPMPVSKKVGDTVFSGTLNTNGIFKFKATKIGSDTFLQNIIRLVEEAQGSKAPIQALADKISSIFVPTVLILSLVALASWLGFGIFSLGLAKSVSYGLVSFVSILIIACPCALGLATPTAIIVGVGKGAREGILIKNAETLEKLYRATVVVLDKTGTITKGKPAVSSIYNFSAEADENLISILASLEKNSEHPIGNAIVSYAFQENISIFPVSEFESLKGKGIKGVIQDREYFAGNARLMGELGLNFEEDIVQKETTQGKTPIILSTKEKILGIVTIADEAKPEAKIAINKLHKMGFKVVMLTGDDKNTAENIAKQVGIDKVFAETLPQDKLNVIKSLQESGEIVVMAGDGVNDAPALAKADVGIAMATGTDVAIESAGITLLHGDISKLTKAIHLSKITLRGIKQNLFWAFIYNIIGIPLAGGLFYPFFGWLLNPIFAGLAMAFSSVSVVGNSLRLKTKKL